MKKPACQTLPQWLRDNLGKGCLAGLTGTDAKALAAAVQTIELYSYCPRQEVAEAFGAIVRQMQPSMMDLAFHAIAHVMDWSDRAAVWHLADLPTDIRITKCAYEPGGSAR